MMEKQFRQVNQPVRKKDAMNLLLGKPAYVCDVTRPDALVVKVLRSPHAHAIIQDIQTTAACKVPGITHGRMFRITASPLPVRRIRSPVPMTV